MRAVLVLFDTLNRRALGPYGGRDGWTPSFERLAARGRTYDRAFVGSMPCIPARRELHTGRSNFLHRSWGPLEPFDDSMPQTLAESGVHTHLVTDHYHYFEDGGTGYHTKYSTWEIVRGQAGDPWKGRVNVDPPENHFGAGMFGGHWSQEWVNREKLGGRLPQEETFELGLEFLRDNAEKNEWFLQIETFDPHEPFWLADQELEELDDSYDGPEFNWPPYRRVTETSDQVEHLRQRYLAVVRRCDRQLGRVLDAFDELDLWKDTLLIVATDHGLLLGEHGWWGKTGPRSRTGPQWFNEIAHIPLFVAGPGVPGATRSDRLVSMVDLPATLLAWFGVTMSPDVQGFPLSESVEDGREGLLFGGFGGHVNVTDGRYVYMRGAAQKDNQPLNEYTLMPVGLGGPASPEALAAAVLHPGFSFTKGCPVLKLPVDRPLDIADQPSVLFDCDTDENQLQAVEDPEAERRLVQLLMQLMHSADAPLEQFQRLGLETRALEEGAARPTEERRP